MAVDSYPLMPVRVEYVPWSWTETASPATVDPFHHRSRINSHNHHDLHPWGAEVKAETREFNALYAQANNQYMYHVWYCDALAPFMAAEVLAIHPLPKDVMGILGSVLQNTLQHGIDATVASPEGKDLIERVQLILEESGVTPEDQIFVRLGATSAKDSWAVLQGVPTMKPPPMKPEAELVLRRLLTSGRVVGRLLALSEGFWAADPGEALVIQRWCENIECRREFRVFCYKGRVTAVSQDIWWEKLEMHEKYSDGFVEAIVELWDNVKALVPFHTCTMDVLMTYEKPKWKAQIVEFNGFGAHLNTGSDLFHWVHDAHILHGEDDGVTVRFIEDKEDRDQPEVEKQKECETTSEQSSVEESAPDTKPDWLSLEEKLRAKFSKLDTGDGEERLAPSQRLKIPLRGR
jgi:hypothetical protein